MSASHRVLRPALLWSLILITLVAQALLPSVARASAASRGAGVTGTSPATSSRLIANTKRHHTPKRLHDMLVPFISGWTCADINSGTGSISESSGVYTDTDTANGMMNGSGNNDTYFSVYQPVGSSTTATISARIVSKPSTGAVGIALRESTDPSARFYVLQIDSGGTLYV